MRVLPRTVRGTWLLAGTVWLALCAAAWWALPAWPRAVIAVPGAHRLLGVGPGGRTVVVDGAEDVNDWPPTVAIRAWDTGAGSIRTVLPAKNGFATRALSPDGQWLAVQEWLADQNRRGIVRTVRLINLITGHDEELARPAGAPAHYEMVFSPDSHWLAVGEQEQESPPGVRLWDVSGRRPGAFLAAAGAPVTFSADSNRLAARAWSPDAEAEGAMDYAVWEVATGRELTRLRKPGIHRVMALTPDGTGLIVEVSDGEKSPTQLPKRYVCWNVANGDERWSARGLWFIRHPVAGGPWLVLARRDPATGANEAVILDAASGSEVSRVSIVTQDWFKDAATDGRTLLIVTPHPLGLDAIWTGLARQGLPGPEPSSAGHLQMLDVATGQRLYALPGVDTAYAADGQCLAVLEPSGRLALWDVPPRKPLLWYAGICALLALSLAWMARRRVRRLRRVAAATS